MLASCKLVYIYIYKCVYSRKDIINNTHGTQCDVAKKTRWKFVPKVSKRF